MKVGTIIPQSLRVETEQYSQGWEIIKNSDADALDRDIRRANWNFSFSGCQQSGDSLGLLERANRTERNRASAGESGTVEI
jgi:hypothetical protein